MYFVPKLWSKLSIGIIYIQYTTGGPMTKHRHPTPSSYPVKQNWEQGCSGSYNNVSQECGHKESPSQWREKGHSKCEYSSDKPQPAATTGERLHFSWSETLVSPMLFLGRWHSFQPPVDWDMEDWECWRHVMVMSERHNVQNNFNWQIDLDHTVQVADSINSNWLQDVSAMKAFRQLCIAMNNVVHDSWDGVMQYPQKQLFNFMWWGGWYSRVCGLVRCVCVCRTHLSFFVKLSYSHSLSPELSCEGA